MLAVRLTLTQVIRPGPLLLQALISFVGDCQDTDLLQNTLELICSLLQRHSPTQRPLLAILKQLGGVQLFVSLVQREQQPVKILGLRIVAAFLPLASHQSPPLSPRSAGKFPVTACIVLLFGATLWPHGLVAFYYWCISTNNSATTPRNKCCFQA